MHEWGGGEEEESSMARRGVGGVCERSG